MDNTNIPPDHPRASSLYTRELLVNGFRKGLVASEGLIAHGRGEAFDYLLGERTTEMAREAARAASAAIILSKSPVISVNGNTAALCSREIIKMAEISGIAIEVNLFYRTVEREQAIERELIKEGAKNVLGVGQRASASIPELHSERRRVDPEGIYKSDTVLVPLEDGDRTEALVRMGKKVITIDLNPLSRTAKTAQITVVDNIVRAMPMITSYMNTMRGRKETELRTIVEQFDNNKNLFDSLRIIREGVGAAKAKSKSKSKTEQ